jgi:hypothetical protein
MKNSPVPVLETATVRLFAYVPAPMIGESPIRPTGLLVSPPVEVAAARFPPLSSATAPTVPSSPKLNVGWPPLAFSSDCHRRSVKKYSWVTRSNPRCCAYSSAP